MILMGNRKALGVGVGIGPDISSLFDLGPSRDFVWRKYWTIPAGLHQPSDDELHL